MSFSFHKEYWLLIAKDRSHDLKTGFWLANFNTLLADAFFMRIIEYAQVLNSHSTKTTKLKKKTKNFWLQLCDSLKLISLSNIVKLSQPVYITNQTKSIRKYFLGILQFFLWLLWLSFLTQRKNEIIQDFMFGSIRRP